MINDGDLIWMRVCRLNELRRLRDIQRRRLLADDMLSRGERRLRDLEMMRRRHDDADDVDILLREALPFAPFDFDDVESRLSKQRRLHARSPTATDDSDSWHWQLP